MNWLVLTLVLILVFIIGLVVGSTYARYAGKKETYRTLRIDRSDPDGPYLFLELDRNVEELSKQKHVVFNVLDKNYISQE